MSNEQFEVRFNAREADYIYNHGVNKGHTLSYSKVNRCYFLSAEAKQLYHNLCSYAWGHKRDCSPCQITLRTELCWSRHSLDTYLNELRDSGLIWTTTQGVKKSLVYNLADLSSVAVIVHSEMVHEVREQLVGGCNEAFYRALKEYKNSELGKKVISFIEDPFQSDDSAIYYYADIKEWFRQALREASGELQSQAEEPQAAAQETPEPASVQTSQPIRRRPTGRTDLSGVVGTSDPDKKAGEGKQKSDPADPETWHATDFYEHFERSYTAKTNQAYLVTIKDRAVFKKLVAHRAGDKTLLLRYMDKFMELDFFPIKTMAIFCSSHTQTVLDLYFRTGKVPDYYGKNGQTSQTAIQRDYDVDDDEFRFENQRGPRK